MTATSGSGRVAFLAPMRHELDPLVEALSLREGELGDGTAYSGVVGDTEIVAALTRIGTVAAARATEHLLDSVTIDHLVVVGIAGGVDPSLEIGDVIVPAVVTDRSTGNEWTPAPFGDVAARGKLVTSDELLLEPTVLAELAQEGVTALDMETASVAEVCERRGCPWSVFRAISDRPSDELVDRAVFDLAQPDGTADPREIERYLAARPGEAARLARLANDMTVAAGAAADAAIRACAEYDAAATR